MESIWIDDIAGEDSRLISKELGISELLAKFLVQRGVRCTQEAKKFLDPSLDNICNPFKLKDMEKAVSRLEKALEKKERICIYGDYDVDGVSSTSLLYLGLKRLGFNLEYYIPSRDHGYGLNLASLEKIAETASIVITVDCGISAFDQIDYANSLGLCVIVTDHHEISKLPNAYAIINPKRVENIYKFTGLAGVGTAFMLLYALCITKGVAEYAYDYLDLVAIGTVSDVVPLISENRIFVKHGLEIMNNPKRASMKLIKEKFFANREPNTIDISFKIAPLFNAAGRLDSAREVVQLLTTDDESVATAIINNLDILNKQRKVIGQQILQNIEISADEKEIIVCASKDYHHGLLGIIAAKLVERHNLPAIVLTIKDGIAQGSARSLKGFNLVEALNKCSDFLIKYGGHANAAGLTLLESNLENFTKKIKEVFRESGVESKKQVLISENLQDFEINFMLLADVKKLKPFGYGNPEPIFSLKDIKISNLRMIGKENTHLMFDLMGRNKIRNVVWFNNASNLSSLTHGSYDIAFKVEESFFNAKNYLKIYTEDIKPNVEKLSLLKYYKNLYSFAFPVKSTVFFEYGIPKGLEIFGEPFYYQQQKLFLGEGVDFLVKELSKNYGFQFKLKVLDCRKFENIYHIDVEIFRNFDLKTKDKTKQILEIKNLLIGDFNYNKMQQDVMKKILVSNESVDLVSKRGRGIKTLALSLALFYYNRTGEKSLYISKDRMPEYMNEFFEYSTSDKNAPFKFVDNVDIEVKGRYLRFFEEMKNSNALYLDEIEKIKNLDIVPIGEELYNRGLRVEHKKIVLQKIREGLHIKAERGILALL